MVLRLTIQLVILQKNFTNCHVHHQALTTKPTLFAILLLFSLGWAVPNHIQAQDNSGEIFRFLRMSTSAQMAGMGGNHVGLWSADGRFFKPAY